MCLGAPALLRQPSVRLCITARNPTARHVPRGAGAAAAAVCLSESGSKEAHARRNRWRALSAPLSVRLTAPPVMACAGYLCSTVEEYAAAIAEVLSMDQVYRLRVAGAARRRAVRFSEQRFKADFLAAVRRLVPKAPAS
jgi:hypothetical protein